MSTFELTQAEAEQIQRQRGTEAAEEAKRAEEQKYFLIKKDVIEKLSVLLCTVSASDIDDVVAAAMSKIGPAYAALKACEKRRREREIENIERECLDRYRPDRPGPAD